MTCRLEEGDAGRSVLQALNRELRRIRRSLQRQIIVRRRRSDCDVGHNFFLGVDWINRDRIQTREGEHRTIKADRSGVWASHGHANVLEAVASNR